MLGDVEIELVDVNLSELVDGLGGELLKEVVALGGQRGTFSSSHVDANLSDFSCWDRINYNSIIEIMEPA